MDYVTRQLINLVKHFRKDLRYSRETLISALNEQTKAVREARQRANREQPPVKLTTVVNLPETIAISHNAADTKNEKSYRFVTIFVAGCSLGAVIVYAQLVYWQYREMIKATGAAKHAVEEAQLNRSQAEREFADTVERSRLEQRAWVGFSEATLLTFDASEVIVRVTPSNSGHTPARHVKIRFRMALSPKPISGPEAEERRTLEKESWETYPDMAPNGVFAFTLGKIETGRNPSADRLQTREGVRQRFPLIQNRTLIYYQYGEISYDDVIGRPHITTFCLFLDDPAKSPLVSACQEFNQIN